MRFWGTDRRDDPAGVQTSACHFEQVKGKKGAGRGHSGDVTGQPSCQVQDALWLQPQPPEPSPALVPYSVAPLSP